MVRGGKGNKQRVSSLLIDTELLYYLLFATYHQSHLHSLPSLPPPALSCRDPALLSILACGWQRLIQLCSKCVMLDHPPATEILSYYSVTVAMEDFQGQEVSLFLTMKTVDPIACIEY